MKPFLRLTEGDDFDATVDLARHTAVAQKKTVIVQRRAKGSGAAYPVLEVTPFGDVLEIPPVPLKCSIGDRFITKVEELDPTNPQHMKSFAAYAGVERILSGRG